MHHHDWVTSGFLQLHPILNTFLQLEWSLLAKPSKGNIWFVHERSILPAITVCCKMTVTPEGDQVMSRRGPEVGQLLGICYITHIHKQHPVVAEWTRSTHCLFCSLDLVLCLNVKQWRRVTMVIWAIESDCFIYMLLTARVWIICCCVDKWTPLHLSKSHRSLSSSIENKKIHYLNEEWDIF